MTLALRLTRLPAVGVGQETLFQHCYLGNALRRHYVTSRSSSATKKPETPSTPIPTNVTDFNTRPKAPDPAKPDAHLKPVSSKPLSQSITKLQQASAALKNETVQKAVAAKAKVSTQEVRKNVQRYMFTRFFDYVTNYDKVLEKTFPSAVKVYRVFFDGVKEFYADMKRFLKVARIVNSSSKGIKALNRKELELYMQMPRDMMKVAPALLFSSLPMVGYAIFPLVVMWPRTFLSSHFWSIQQRADFNEYYFHERLTYNRAVFRCLQARLECTERHPKHQEFAKILGQLGSGTHPTVDQILDVKSIFDDTSYSLVSLSGKHIKLLSKLHGLRQGMFKRHRLFEHAYLVHYMDVAICREGGVHNMPLDALRNACYIRGLNPINLSNDDMITWLRDWIKVSNSLEAEHITLFLHLPLLLAYNHPNNWQLLYGKDKSKQPHE